MPRGLKGFWCLVRALAFAGVASVLCGAASAADIALVLSSLGKVAYAEGPKTGAVDALVRLRAGDRLRLDAGSRLQLLYSNTGRVESWTGPGDLEVGENAARSTTLAPPVIRSMLPVVAGQIARSPVPGDTGRGGRTRAIATDEALASLDHRYRELRGAAAPEDLAPEMFLLSGLFEMRQMERVEGVIETLQREQARNPEAALVIALYKRALRNARASKRQ